MRKRKLIWISLLVIALMAFGFFVLSHTAKRAPNVKVLPDGTTLRLGTVEFTNGLFSYSSGLTGWPRLVAPFIPKSMKKRLGWSSSGATMSFGGGQSGTNLCVFTIHEVPTVGTPMEFRTVVFDDQGNAFDLAYPQGVCLNSDLLQESRAEGWCPPAFPRRGEMLGLRVYPRGQTNAQCLAEFTFPNPAPGNYPVWTPQSLPATKTNKNLSVTLAALKTGLCANDKSRPASSNEVAITQAVFRLVQAGRESNSWRPVQVEISDATGNKWTPWPHLIPKRHADGLDYFSIDGALWPGESAWKLRFEFSRVADFGPKEIFTLGGIPVPGATQNISLENITNIAGSEIRLVAITGINAEQPGNLKWSTVKGYVNISVRISARKGHHRLTLLKVTDESGREAKIKQAPDWNSPERLYTLTPPKGAKQLNFTFAYHESRFVEFLAKPEDARTN